MFFRVIEDDPATKQLALSTLLTSFAGQAYIANTNSFSRIPGAPFAYWVNAQIQKLYTTSDCLETRYYKTYQLLITADDTRFLCLDWECPSAKRFLRCFVLIMR